MKRVSFGFRCGAKAFRRKAVFVYRSVGQLGLSCFFCFLFCFDCFSLNGEAVVEEGDEILLALAVGLQLFEREAATVY